MRRSGIFSAFPLHPASEAMALPCDRAPAARVIVHAGDVSMSSLSEPLRAVLVLCGLLACGPIAPVAHGGEAAPAEENPLTTALAAPAEDGDPASAAAWDKRLFDKQGKLMRNAYIRAAASMEPKDVDHRLGPDHAFYHPRADKTDKKPGDDAATAPRATRGKKVVAAAASEPATIDGFPLDAPRHANGHYIYKEAGKNAVDWTGHGGQVIYLPDQPNATGMDKLAFCWTEHENHGGKQFWHNYQLRPGIGQKDGGQWWSGSPDPALRASAVLAGLGKDPNRTPSAIGRGRGAWANQAVIAFRSGLITISGTGNNGDHPHLVVQLPPGKVPTAVAVTPGNELALVTVWDVGALKGQVAVIALGSSPQQQPILVPSTAFFSRMKLLGLVDLPIATPSSIAASTDIIAWDGVSSDLGKDAFDFSKPEVRERWAKGPAGHSRNIGTSLPRCSYAVIASRAESRVVFLDLAPFFTWLRSMYLGTQKDYEATTKVGDGPDQWPFTFEHAPKARPVVAHTLKVPQPTAVAAGFPTGDDAGFATKAMVTTLDGRLVVIEVGQLASASAKPGPIIPVGMVAVGRNPTSICYGARQFRPHNQVAIASRGDRRISWVRIAGGTPVVQRTLEDPRFEDPVAVESGDYRGALLITIADFRTRRIINYLTQPISSWGDRIYGGLGRNGDAPFECTGFTTVPGHPFLLSGAEVP
jgi:hypothetical protein